MFVKPKIHREITFAFFAVSNSDIKVNRAAQRKWRQFLWGNNAELEKHEYCCQVFQSKAKISQFSSFNA